MIRPDTLTDAMVESLVDAGLDPNHAEDRYLGRDIATWKRCSVERRLDHPAAYRICEALNARQGADVRGENEGAER